MEQIIARQNAAARPVTGKRLLLACARAVLTLALAQMAVGKLIQVTGIAQLAWLVYALAVLLVMRMASRAVCGCAYTLTGDTLALQRMQGDHVALDMKIPLSSIVSVRPYAFGQRLKLDYRQVTYADPACAPGLRMRIAFAVSYLWSGLARAIAGKTAAREAGLVAVYLVGKRRRACAFRPDAAFAAALKAALPEVFDSDERLSRDPLETYAAQSLRRAFGTLYPHVPEAVTAEEIAASEAEFARRREEKLLLRAKKKKIPPETYREQLAKKERKKASRRRKMKKNLARLAGCFAFLQPVGETFASIYALLMQEEPQESPKETQKDAPRRRRADRRTP